MPCFLGKAGYPAPLRHRRASLAKTATTEGFKQLFPSKVPVPASPIRDERGKENENWTNTPNRGRLPPTRIMWGALARAQGGSVSADEVQAFFPLAVQRRIDRPPRIGQHGGLHFVRRVAMMLARGVGLGILLVESARSCSQPPGHGSLCPHRWRTRGPVVKIGIHEKREANGRNCSEYRAPDPTLR